MLISVLEQIGLSEKQAKIYLACLELGEATIKEIADKSDVGRTSIYDIIAEMMDLGFLRQMRRGQKRKFVAANPEELKRLTKKRLNSLEEIFPKLLRLSHTKKNPPKVWFYEGIEGLKKVFEDTLSYPNSTMCQWSSEHLVHILGKEWVLEYVKSRALKKIFVKAIGPVSKEAIEFKEMDPEHLRQIKMVNKEKFPFEIELDIYANRVAMISGKDRMGVIIESAPIANTLRSIFEYCWEKED